MIEDLADRGWHQFLMVALSVDVGLLSLFCLDDCTLDVVLNQTHPALWIH